MTTKNTIAATAIVERDGWRVSLAEENVGGHSPLNYGPFKTEEEAQRLADTMNKRLGLTREEVIFIVLSSMHPQPEHLHLARKTVWARMRKP